MPINDNLKKLTIKTGESTVTDNILVKYAEQLRGFPINISDVADNDLLIFNDSTESWINVDFSYLENLLGLDADNITYSNTNSGLVATNVQDAIDEVKTAIDNVNVDVTFNIDGGTSFTEFGLGDISLDGGGA
jgi:hypothetical protein